MKKKERQVLMRYIRECADAFGLQDWDFRLQVGGCEDDSSATVHIPYGRKYAKICVHPTFREDQDEEEQRETILHELTHCHLEPSSAMVFGDLDKLLGRPADTVFQNAYRRQFEYAVDGISVAAARFFPMIDWEDA